MTQHSGTGQFIRGGQTTQHWYRMAVQVLRYAFFVMLTVFTTVLAVWSYVHYDHEKFIKSRYWVLARINIYRAMPDFPLRVSLPDGQIFTRSSEQIYRAQSFRESYYFLERKATAGMIVSTQAGMVFGILSFAIFFAAGRKLGHDEHIRGAQLVPLKELKSYVDTTWKDLKSRDASRASEPRYSMGGLEFPPDALVAQTGIFGTTGSGKTTLIKDLIVSIRASGGHALVYDRTGEFTAAFYDEDRDIIINPFDQRSHCWSPFHDANTAESFTQIYDVLIPARSGDKDPFWSKSARIVAEFVSRELVQRGKATNAQLRDALMNIPLEKLEKLIHDTPAEKFIGEQAGKMGTSVYATMLAELRFLEFLRDDGPKFSARDWVRSIFARDVEDVDPDTGEVIDAPKPKTSKKKKKGDASDGSFVFLTGHPEFDAATRNITSAIMELSATALMGCKPSYAPKLFFIIDELATLNKLPFLTGKLAEVRKVGGCFVVGFQVLSQLEDIYGKEGANTVMGNLNNTIFGSTPDHTTAEKFSKALGMVDQIESRENISVGANENRDGVGFIKNRFERAIATPTEIMRLPQLHAYFTFAYDSPTALVKFPRSKVAATQTAMIPYTGSGFGTGSLDPERFIESASFRDAAPHKQAAEFVAWLRAYQTDHLGPDAAQLTDGDKKALWAHYATERIAGHTPNLIGPPALDRELAVTLEDAAQGNAFSPHAYGGDDLPADAFDHTKPGPRIILAGATHWDDRDRIFDMLDQTFYKHNNMVLCHRATVGADLIAARWAEERQVPQMAFRPKFDLYGQEAVQRSVDDLFQGSVRGVLLFGTGPVVTLVREGARQAKAKVKDVTALKSKQDLPPYPLQDSPTQMYATPAASAQVKDAPPTDACRRTSEGGATKDKKPVRKTRVRARKEGVARARAATQSHTRERAQKDAAKRQRTVFGVQRKRKANGSATAKARRLI